MSTAQLAKELAALPQAERVEVLRAALRDLDPSSREAVERLLLEMELSAPSSRPLQLKWPDFEARLKRIFGDKVLAGNAVLEERESYRW